MDTGSVTSLSIKNLSFANDPNLQRVFDFYLLKWLWERGNFSFDNGIRFGIARVLDTDKPDKVEEYLNPDEPVLVELPKVRVEGLEGILEEVVASISPLVRA